jgi:hypothetical protein
MNQYLFSESSIKIDFIDDEINEEKDENEMETESIKEKMSILRKR